MLADLENLRHDLHAVKAAGGAGRINDGDQRGGGLRRDVGKDIPCAAHHDAIRQHRVGKAGDRRKGELELRTAFHR